MRLGISSKILKNGENVSGPSAGFWHKLAATLSRWWKTADRTSLIITWGLMVLGLIVQISSSYSTQERLHRPGNAILLKTILATPVAVIALAFLSTLTVKQVRRVGITIFLLALILLLATPILGNSVKGASRWIYLGSLSFEPSEIIKPTFAIISAWLLVGWRRGEPIAGHWISLLFLIIILFTLALQPDFGQMLLLSGMYTVQLVVLGLPLLWIGIFIMAGLASISIAYFSVPYINARIHAYLNYWSGHAPYQIRMSIDSFKEGGLFGVGLGQGNIKYALPDAHTDFIFSIVAEELGVLFAIGLLATVAFLLLHLVWRLSTRYDLFSITAGSALITQIAVQILVNVNSSLGLIPTKGMTFPFLSSGVSSLIGATISMGFLLAISSSQQHRS